MLTWLRACETAVRHLLLIEAAAIVGALPRSRASAQKHLRTHRPFIRDPDYPEAWRVSFRWFMDRRRPRRYSASSKHAVRPERDPYADYFIDPAAEAARAEYAAWLARMRV